MCDLVSQKPNYRRMNAVYDLSGPKNDFEAALIDPGGLLTLPSFDCPACGSYGARPSVWYASLLPESSEAHALCEKPFPEKVPNLKAFLAIRDKVRSAFRTDVNLWPGYLVGARPITVKSRGTISELTTKKLKQGIDIIWATFSCVLSTRAMEVLQELGLFLPSGSVTFRSGDRLYPDYRVLELQPQPVWTESERSNYGVRVCNVCGESLKTVLGGSFRMKQFRAEVFRDGNVLVRGAEVNSIYVNQPVYDRLAKENLTGLSFRKAGEWV